MSFKRNKTEEKANPPVHKVRVGLITAAIWEKATDKGTFYNVTFERRYKDADGNWKSTDSYDTFDLLNLAKAADLAHTKILEAQEDDRNTERPEG
jgi:hypothetical protein